MTTYFATYRETDETTEEWHDYLVQQAGALASEPSEIETIADLCATARVSALLHDAAGFLVGRVASDGRYWLG